MVKSILCFFACLTVFYSYSQTYSPIDVSGFNHDVIAEGTGPSSLAVTTKEMDALTPSNFVICTQEFAMANSIPAGYGIPSNGFINSGTKTYQLTPLGNGTATANNALYLLKGEFGTLTLATPGTFNSLSFLCTATEGPATVNATIHYTDGTTQVFNLTFIDWVGSTTAILSGFGRIKRIAGPFPAGTYEQAPNNPRIYSTEVTTACNKVVGSVEFANVSGGTGTSSNRAFVFAISGDTATLPVAPVINIPDTICAGKTAVLTLQSPDPTLTYTWYGVATGGTILYSGTSFTTPNLSTATTYYIQSANAGGCASTRTPVTVNLFPVVVKATADTAKICAGQTATLTVTNVTAGIIYSWYTTASGGSPFFTGDSYTTPVLTGSATYYIEAANAAGCKSISRTPVVVIVTPLPLAPVVTADTVCPGQTATITVTNPASTIVYNYYTASTGGTAVGTGTSFTTPPVTGAVTYYIEALNSAGCISSIRTPVTVTIAPEPAAPAATVTSICEGQTATINITNPAASIVYSYYNTATGGAAISTGVSFTTPPVTGTVTYYIEASNAGGCISSTRTPVSVTATPLPNAPIVSVTSACSGQTATITITNPNATITYSYYTTATGGSAIATGTSFTTPPVTGTFTYYIEASNSGGCISSTRTAITVTALASPAAPVATVTQVCSRESATITITNPDATLVYNYYTAPTGGTSVGTGASYTTPPIFINTIYYVEATNASGCSSGRTPVFIILLPLPLTPAVTVSPICSGQSATINITNPDPTIVYTYYATVSGGVALGTGTTFTTPPVSDTVIIFIEVVNANGCKGLIRTPIIINTFPQPIAPAASVSQVCSGQPATISITNPDATVVYSYYTSASGGVALASGNSFTTPPVTTSIFYYIEASNSNGCISSTRTVVTVSVAPVLSTPVVTVTSITNSSVTVSWTAISGATSYQVSVNGGPFSTPSSGSTGTTHVATGLPAGQPVTFAVKAFAAIDCQSSGVGNVSAVTPSTHFFIPNTFTPNGDGRNDRFLLYGDAISIDLKIFNQWGQMIFASKDVTNGWDGTFKGKAQPTGIYMYVVTAALSDGSQLFRKGALNLIR